MNTLILSITIITNSITGGLTFSAQDGKAICGVNESGPTQVTSVSAPAGTPSSAFKECEYGVKTVTRYSVRSIIGELKKIGKYAQFRAFLESANYDWDFLGSNYLASSDPDFVAMLTAIVANGILTQGELDELLPKCLWEQTPMAN